MKIEFVELDLGCVLIWLCGVVAAWTLIADRPLSAKTVLKALGSWITVACAMASIVVFELLESRKSV